MESIVRFAFAKYKETGVANSLSEAVRMCLNEDIFRDPRVKTSWMDFRKNNLYNRHALYNSRKRRRCYGNDA